MLNSLHGDGQGGWTMDTLITGLGNDFTCIAEGNDLELYTGNCWGSGTLYKIVDPINVGSTGKISTIDHTVYPNPARENLVIEGDLRSVR